MVHSKFSTLITSFWPIYPANTLVVTGTIATCVCYIGVLGGLRENRCMLITVSMSILFIHQITDVPIFLKKDCFLLGLFLLNNSKKKYFDRSVFLQLCTFLNIYLSFDLIYFHLFLFCAFWSSILRYRSTRIIYFHSSIINLSGLSCSHEPSVNRMCTFTYKGTKRGITVNIFKSDGLRVKERP